MTLTNSVPLTLETITQGRHYLLVADGSGPGGNGTGTGGWACVLQLKQGDQVLHQKPFAGRVIMTTNSQMEMIAPLAAFAAMQEAETPVLVQSDSQFLIKGMNVWRSGWIAKGWRKGDGKPVANQDLWKLLIAPDQSRPVIWNWVRGHSGHALNELADQLASDAKAGKNVDENGRVTKFKKGLSF